MSTSYYKRPELGKDADTYTQRLTEIQAATEQSKATVAEKDKALTGMSNVMKLLQIRAGKGDRTAAEKYNSILGQYRIAYLERVTAANAHNKNVEAYQQAYTAYENYYNKQKELEGQWRSTIRDSATVKAELDAVQAQIEKLSRQDAVGKALTAIGNAAQTAMIGSTGLAPSAGQYQSQNAAELAQLQEREKLLQEEYDWGQHYYYADMQKAADFDAKSQYKTTYRGGEEFNAMAGIYTDSGFDDIAYDYINRNETAQNRKALSDIQSNASVLGLDNSERGQMTDEEIGIFNYVYATQGKDAAYQYIDYLTSDLNARQRAADEAQWAEWTKEKPVAMSLLSTAMSPLKGLSYIGQTADLASDGKIDQNAGYNKFSYLNSAVRNQVSEDIKGSIKSEFWGNAGSFGYQTAMSMADFLTTTAVTGGNSALAMTIMGSGAAADTVIEAKDRGLNDHQAFWLGTIAGAAEAVTEKFSLEALLDKTSLGKNAAGYILKNVLAEGSEEGASTLINTMADVLISKDKSQWQMAIDAHKADGKTDGQAFGLALGEQALALIVDIAGGALSGGVMAGGNVAINKVGGAIQGKVPQVQAQAKTLQEAVQQQVAQRVGTHVKIQAGTVELALPTVQYTQEMWDQSSRLAKLTGRNIRLYEDTENVNGSYDPETGLIWVNTKGNDVLAQVFSHEMTHSLEGVGLYEKLSSVVLNRMQDTGINLDNAREAKRQQYARQGHALQSDTAVDQELVAEYVSRYLLTDEQSIVDLVQKNRTLGQRIVGWFNGLLAKMGNKNAQEWVFLSKARDLYVKALRQTQSVGAAQAQQAQQKAATAPMGEQAAAKTETGETTTLDDLDTQLAADEITDEEYDDIRDELELAQEEMYTAGERKYSLREFADDGRRFVDIDQDQDRFDGHDPSEYPRIAKGIINEKFNGRVIGIDNKMFVNGAGRDEFVNPSKPISDDYHQAKMRTAGELDNLLDAGFNFRNAPDGADGHVHPDVVGGFDYFDTIFKIGDRYFNAVINIKNVKRGKLFKDVTKIEDVTQAIMSSYGQSPKSQFLRTSSMDSIRNSEPDVKRQFSLSDDEAARDNGNGRSSNKKQGSNSETVGRDSDTVSKKDVARELQAILQRGGDVSELRRYVAQLEGSGRKTEQSGRSAEQKQGEAEQILEKAKRRGVSVEQYLQENAELYESDGRWNADARRALELEKKGSGRKYSVSEETETATAEEKSDVRSTMPKKAKDYLKRVERELLWAIADKLSVPKLAGREYLQPIIQEMSDTYLKEGTIPQETVELLFEKAYAQGVVVDAEFYNAYKHIKDHLRNLSVTISDRDKADIADFNDFRKRAFGTLRIVNEGGLPVDTAYQELHSMAPELFPENITHPADQLVRMYDAARSIQVTEKTVQDYYGEYEPEYRRWAKADFEAAVQDAIKDLWTVKRYAEDKASEASEKAPATEAEAMEAYKELKKARRAYEKVAAKNLLSSQDEMQVGRLLRHEIELEHLDPKKDNVKGIAAVFEAKQEYDRLCKLVTEYKKHLRGQARKKADAILTTANEWKDKKLGIAYSRETMERNIYDIVKDKKLAKEIIDQYFRPVHEAEAAATRFKNDYRDRVRAMDLSRKVAKGNTVSEAHAVQLLGEAEDNIRMLENARGRIKNRDGKNLSEWRAVVEKLWAENPNLDKGKIEKAVKDFRYIYDALFQKMNQVRVANGYEPVNYRNGYFPHFQPGDSDSILAQFGRALGIDTRIDALPTTINGLTHTFKPGIQWMGNAQERIGFNTAYDAVEGFDKYIEGVAGVIYQTQNIQNLRALASQIRYRTSDEGIRQQVDEIYQRRGLTEEEKQQLIQEVYAHGKFTLSNFVTELDEYTNLLANKKSRYDRSIEAAMGRKAYTVLKALEARVGANMIAGNLTSALTNFIPLTQAGAQMDRFALLQGMWQTLQAYRSDDGIVNQSTFLTNRRGSDPLVQTWAQKASEKLGKPMELIDGFVSDSIVRGAYAQNLKRGMNEVDAMAEADAFAASVMADRSKGAMPTLMQASNPLFKAFTQFQLEVNNQFSEVFKDIPRRFKEKGRWALALVLLKYFLGACLFNALYEKLIGRRPALDPIGMLCQFSGDWTGLTTPNIIDMWEGGIHLDDFQTEKVGFGQAVKRLSADALGQLPFSSGLTLIGVELDGGRIPVSSAIPDLTALWDAAAAEGWSAEKRWKEVQGELWKLACVVPPLGGNQISKTVKGAKAYFQGGSYAVEDIDVKDENGNVIGVKGMPALQYPVYKDEPKDAFWSLVQAAFLGKSSLDTAQDWVGSNFKGLNAKQTAAYQELLEIGANDRDAFAAVVQVRDAGSKVDDKLQAVRKTPLTDEEKFVLVGLVIGTDMLTESGGLTQYAKFDYAVQNGMSVDQYIDYRSAGGNMDKYLEMRDAGLSVEEAINAGLALVELKGSAPDATAVQTWKTVIGGIEDPERQLMALSAVMSDSHYRKALTAKGFGVSPDLYVQANELLQKFDADGNGRFTQGEVTKALGTMKCSSRQKAALWQLITGSSSAKNNPYSSTIGQRVIDALEKAKSQEEETGLSFQDEIMRQIMGG